MRKTSQRYKKILDAKYKQLECKPMVRNKNRKDQHKDFKLKLIERQKKMFDITFDNNKGSDYKIELKEYTIHYHTNPFPLAEIPKSAAKKEFTRLVDIQVLKT